jgi:hypothetical protein
MKICGATFQIMEHLHCFQGFFFFSFLLLFVLNRRFVFFVGSEWMCRDHFVQQFGTAYLRTKSGARLFFAHLRVLYKAKLLPKCVVHDKRGKRLYVTKKGLPCLKPRSDSARAIRFVGKLPSHNDKIGSSSQLRKLLTSVSLPQNALLLSPPPLKKNLVVPSTGGPVDFTNERFAQLLLPHIVVGTCPKTFPVGFKVASLVENKMLDVIAKTEACIDVVHNTKTSNLEERTSQLWLVPADIFTSQSAVAQGSSDVSLVRYFFNNEDVCLWRKMQVADVFFVGSTEQGCVATFVVETKLIESQSERAFGLVLRTVNSVKNDSKARTAGEHFDYFHTLCVPSCIKLPAILL